MLRKSTLLAVAASAVLGLAMLSPDVASAEAVMAAATVAAHGGGAMAAATACTAVHGGRGMHGRLVATARAFPPPPSAPPGTATTFAGTARSGTRGRSCTAATACRTRHPGPCTCLSKEYTQEGAVLFKDNCTNEMAMNPPAEAPAPTAEVAPQQQPQTAYVPQYPPQPNTATR